MISIFYDSWEDRQGRRDVWYPRKVCKLFENFMQDTEKSVKELEGMNFAHGEREGFKEQLKELTRKVDKLKDEELNMEVYLRQESHCFFGTEELSTTDSNEDTRQIVVDFLKDKLGIINAENLKFQRVHRIRQFSNLKEKSRQMITRFPPRPEIHFTHAQKQWDLKKGK